MNALNAVDVLDVCAVMLERCGLTAEQLAAHMSRPELPKAQPRDAGDEPDALPERLASAMTLARRACGVTVEELAEAEGLTLHTAKFHLRRLRERKLIFCVLVPGSIRRRWFETIDAGAAWLAAAQMSGPAPDIAPARPTPAPSYSGAPGRSGQVPPPAPAPAPRLPRNTVVMPRAPEPIRPQGDVIVPPGVRITVAPTPAPRFSPAVHEPLTGGFSTSRPGINPVTGQPW